MNENWAHLSPEEKRAKRLAPYFNPEHITFNSEAAEERYHRRVARILKVYQGEEPDRVPVSLPQADRGLRPRRRLHPGRRGQRHGNLC
jgi:hypothetical protein